MKEDLNSLISQLQNTKQGSRELDAAIVCALRLPVFGHDAADNWSGDWTIGQFNKRAIVKLMNANNETGLWSANFPKYTSDLNACKAFQKTMLPDFKRKVGFDPLTDAYNIRLIDELNHIACRAEHDDECLAWSIAILKSVKEIKSK